MAEFGYVRLTRICHCDYMRTYSVFVFCLPRGIEPDLSYARTLLQRDIADEMGFPYTRPALGWR